MTGGALQRLRRHAIGQSLFRPTHLKGAIERLGFVQADPIRSPARAQDLILRHRVKNYRAGDLERRYSELDIEEDFLYAYGFVSRSVWCWLHPRSSARLTALEKKVLSVVCDCDEMHPRELEPHLGRQRAVNAWGGYSNATTRALQHLHYRGLLRIVRRENGIRVYQSLTPPPEPLPLAERLQKLVLLVAGILAPVPERSLREALGHLTRHVGDARAQISSCERTGQLQKETIEGLSYVWPAASKTVVQETPRKLRILAPFDPVVWDRRRFEHLWGWAYRFEAYTPPAKRVRGYYAMPLLWGDAVIGWANLSVEAGHLDARLGFIGKTPDDAEFRLALDEELERIGYFLGSGEVGGTMPLSRRYVTMLP
jgi:uncharacterized protein